MQKREIIIEDSFSKKILADLTLPEGQGPFPMIVFMHGVRGFKDWGAWHLIAQYFAERGFAFLKFNFSYNGIGQKSLKEFDDLKGFSENNFLIELSDLEKVISWVKTQSFCDASKINLLAHSRGGGLAIIYANQNPSINSVTTMAAVSDYHRYVGAWDIKTWQENGFLEFINSRTKQIFKINWQFWEVLEANKKLLDIKQACQQLSSPLLVIHSEDDPAVSVNQAHELSSWTDGSKLFITREGGHTFGISHPWPSETLPDVALEVCDRMVEFFGDQ